MASRKNLKKQIKCIGSELYAQSILTLLSTRCDKGKVLEIVTKIIKLQEEFTLRAGHAEPGNVKPYYKKLRGDFDAGADEIVTLIEDLRKNAAEKAE